MSGTPKVIGAERTTDVTARIDKKMTIAQEHVAEETRAREGTAEMKAQEDATKEMRVPREGTIAQEGGKTKTR